MKFSRFDRHAEFPRQLAIAQTGFQRGKKIAFPVCQACKGIRPDLTNIHEREHHVSGGDRREHFKQAFRGESLLKKPAPPSRRPGVWPPAAPARLRGPCCASAASVGAARVGRATALGHPIAGTRSYRTERVAHRKNVTVFSKSSFESCFK